MKFTHGKFIASSCLLSLLSSCLPVFLFVISTSGQPRRKVVTKQKYNVLFVGADDLRPELGAYGVTAVKTLGCRSEFVENDFPKSLVVESHRSNVRMEAEFWNRNSSVRIRKSSGAVILFIARVPQSLYITAVLSPN